MINRIKQVISAITAKIEPSDVQFIAQNLSTSEQLLFWGMNLPDQRHALNVAYTGLRLIEESFWVNRNLLIRCALLHDVGKVQGDVSTVDKIITVLGYKIAPHWACAWGRPGRGNKLDNIRHAFYTYFYHAAHSAAMLESIGVEQTLIDIVAKHHLPPSADDPIELILLRQADNLN